MSRRPTGRADSAAERKLELLEVVYRNFERWEAHGRALPGCAIRARL